MVAGIARKAGYGVLLLLIGCNGDPQLQDTRTLLEQQPETREYVYECADGSRFDARYEAATDEMVLFLPNRAVRLAHVKSASGARYATDDLVFWSKGDAALLIRGDNDQLDCQRLTG